MHNMALQIVDPTLGSVKNLVSGLFNFHIGMQISHVLLMLISHVLNEDCTDKKADQRS